MSMESKKSSAASSQGTGTSVYQCVCGGEVPVLAGRERLVCPKCGRTIQSSVIPSSAMSFGATVIGGMTDDVDFESSIISAGDRLDHFTVLEPLGAGGMGAVFRAKDESLQRFVAIKVIRSRQSEADRVRRERLVEEARSQARVNHPNVVHIYYVGLHDECPFFAMELVPGQSLAKLVSERRLTFQEIVQIGLQTANALAHSASLGVIHGDVKPGNLLLSDCSLIKLSDFGLASRADDAGASSSQTGPAGTLNYMAPEVAAGQPANIQSDMYSLGVMLYELTFGELPHEASSESLEENLKARQLATVSFPKVWPKDRPEEFRGFLNRLLANDPNKRFRDYAELINELQLWQPTELINAGRVSRLVAYFLDLLLTGVMFGLAIAASFAVRRIGGSWISEDSVHVPIMIMFAAAVVWPMVHFKMTVGKKLMQLRVVDDFGLPPKRIRAILFVLNSYLWLLIAPVTESTEMFARWAGYPQIHDGHWSFQLLNAALVLWVVLNGAWILFSRRRQSLLDRWLGLNVVLDTRGDRRGRSSGEELT